jgi:hypothetical protein
MVDNSDVDDREALARVDGDADTDSMLADRSTPQEVDA